MSAKDLSLYIETPVIVKTYDLDGNGNKLQVYFKLENLQPSGSFKDRGIGHMIATLIEQEQVEVLITSSGGNAGHSVACIGQKLGIHVKVFVPITTKPMMRNKIESTGAEVLISGANWNEADVKAREAVDSNPKARYIPPFDDPLIWEGHSSMIEELKQYFESSYSSSFYPDDLVLSVGGGGLLAGVQLGLKRVGWNETKILAVETTGAASFAAAKSAGRVVSLEKIDTIATTLGALAVTGVTLTSDIITEPVIVTDQQAIYASYAFANDLRMLVEPACGASLSLIYLDELRKQYFDVSSTEKPRTRKVVVIVCGGSAVSLELLNEWKEKYISS